jgi:hypothetical protein
MDGVGFPLAAETKDTDEPRQTAVFVGLAVTTGAEPTVTVALPDPVLLQRVSDTAVTE